LRNAAIRLSRRSTNLAVFLAVAWPAAILSGQSVTVSAAGDALQVRAPGFGIIKGDTLNRLKNGQTVRFDLELTVLEAPAGQPAFQAQQSFVLSYDLWEERFAVTRAGSASRSISHLTSAGAEAWCLSQLAVPLSGLGRLGRDAPFWIRLEYRIQDRERTARDGDAGFTLRGLIDVLSRRSKAGEPGDSIQGGPFTIDE
jgi:hypothetical protein